MGGTWQFRAHRKFPASSYYPGSAPGWGHSVHATFVLALDLGDWGETDKFSACRELFFGAGRGGEQAGKCFQFCVISKSCHQVNTGAGKYSWEGMPVPDFEGRTGERSDL